MEDLKRSGSSTSTTKSLGDLTSDDIAPSFDSKYRSIRRSFVVRGSRGGRGERTTDDLTAQLRRLADVEPLETTTTDPAGNRGGGAPRETEEGEGLLVRKASSRSQSRVRSINNRAKKNQERLRLLGQRNAPIEERGNPEGACSVTHSNCSGRDPLGLGRDPLGLNPDLLGLNPPDPSSPRIHLYSNTGKL